MVNLADASVIIGAVLLAALGFIFAIIAWTSFRSIRKRLSSLNEEMIAVSGDAPKPTSLEPEKITNALGLGAIANSSA